MTSEQRDHFEARGFVRLRGVFSRDAAASMEERVWALLGRKHGMRRDDPASWRAGTIEGLQSLKRQAVFDAIGGETLLGTLDALLGAERWKRPKDWGGFLVSFPSAGETRARGPWHTDFDYRGPRDRVFGALVFSYLSDVPAGAGGTLVVAGSHRLIRRFVEAQAGALGRMKTVRRAFMRSDPWLAALAAEENAGRLALDGLFRAREVAGVPVEVVELCGEAGDVVIGHPWLLHRAAPNRGERPRFMRVQRVSALLSMAAAVGRRPRRVRNRLREERLERLHAAQRDGDASGADARDRSDLEQPLADGSGLGASARRALESAAPELRHEGAQTSRTASHPTAR